MTLEHAPLACDDCLATASAFLADGPFTVRLRDVGDSTAIVVTPDALAAEILAYFANGLANARTEGFNNREKLVKKRAYGGRSFRNYRLRLLNACA